MSMHEQATPAELSARWSFRVRNEVSVALHAMDVGNYAAARVALESAQQFIGMLENQDRQQAQLAAMPKPPELTT